MNNEDPIDYNKPVAYDHQGRPLYAHPPKIDDQHKPKPVNPGLYTHPGYQGAKHDDKHHVSEYARKRHAESAAKYPALNLSEGEYVITDVHRHPAGLFMPLAISTLLVLGTVAALVGYPALFPSGKPPFSSVFVTALLFILLVVLVAYIMAWIYMHNRLILTNESVIQETQHALMTRHEQTITLGNIEDVSFKKNNIFQSFFNFGTIRISTEGQETTYLFHYADNPRKYAALIHNATERFKRGHQHDDM